jgi:hypothetical protein
MSATLSELTNSARKKTTKVAWYLPRDVIAILRAEAARLQINEGRLVAAILAERIPTFLTRPLECYPAGPTVLEPTEQAKPKPRNDVCRSSPSCVHSANATSQTGLTAVWFNYASNSSVNDCTFTGRGGTRIQDDYSQTGNQYNDNTFTNSSTAIEITPPDVDGSQLLDRCQFEAVTN